MKLSDGLTKLIPTIMIYVAYVLSFIFFPLALKRIDLSTAYAIWSGLGTTLTCVIGFVYFGDIINLTKILALEAKVTLGGLRSWGISGPQMPKHGKRRMTWKGGGEGALRDQRTVVQRNVICVRCV